MADVYGRKKTLIVAVTFQVYFVLLSVASDSYVLHVVLRFLVGVGYGGCIVLTVVYSTEFTSRRNHAKAVLFLNDIFIFGSLAAIGVSYFTLTLYGWRNFILWSILPYILLICLMLLMPESIRFLSINGETDKVSDMLDEIAMTSIITLPANFHGEEISTGRHITKGQSPGYFTVFTKHWKKILGLSINGVPIFLSFYGIPFFIDYKIQHPSSCGFNDATVMMKCAPLTDSQILRSFWINFGLLPGSIIGYFVVEKQGRKILLGFTTILMAISYFTQLLCLPSVMTYVLLFLSSGFGSSSTCFLFLFSSELFPTNIRSTASGISATIWKVFSILSPLLFQHLIYIEWNFVVVFMGSLSVLGIVGLGLLPETLGQNLNDY
eukprot:TCONS_00049850-protein